MNGDEEKVSKMSSLGVAGYIAIAGFTSILVGLGWLTYRFSDIAIQHYNTLLGFLISTTNLAVGYFLRDRAKG